MPKQTFAGYYSNLEQICNFVVAAAQDAGLDDSAVYGVQLAVDEACTNIIEHGYGGEGKGEIECTCEVLSNGLKVVLKDHAEPFDPLDVPDPRRNLPLEEIRPRGLGLFLMRKMMDDVDFRFSPKGNTLTMVKRRK